MRKALLGGSAYYGSTDHAYTHHKASECLGGFLSLANKNDEANLRKLKKAWAALERSEGNSRGGEVGGKCATLRGLLAALDDPSLTRLLGACAEASVRMPPSSDAAAMRRAYLLAIKRVHPDKLGTDSTLTERLTANAIFDVLREAHERGAGAASSAEAVVEGAPSAAEAEAKRAARKWRAKAAGASDYGGAKAYAGGDGIWREDGT